MRFLSFSHGGTLSYGAATSGGIVDLGARHPELPDLRDAIRRGRIEAFGREAAGAIADLAFPDVEFLPTIPNPEKIVCIGVNYRNRSAEYADGSKAPKYPSVFMRARESIVGHRQAILDPPESNQLDYEGEIAIVIGREGRRIARERAREHIAGLAIMNEGTLRDYLRHGKFNVTQGKNFEHSGSLGPWFVTPDELDPLSELRVMTRVSGELRQNDTTANLMFPFDYLIAYLSTFFRLKPGDVIATGTPKGAGARLDPPRYLKTGDVVTVEVPGLGVLENPVTAESP